MKRNELSVNLEGHQPKKDGTSAWSDGGRQLILKSRADDAVKKINTGIIMELSLSFFLCVIGTFFFLLDKDLNVFVLVVFYIICIASMVFYGIKLSKINKIRFTGNDFKTSLGELIRLMRGYIRIYTFSGVTLMIGFPFVFSLPRIHPNDGTGVVILTWGAGIILAIAVFMGIRWYVNKLYGNYCAELKECFDALKD